MKQFLLPLTAAVLATLAGCRDSHSDHKTAEKSCDKAHHHEHTPPHGGTAVVLGDEQYHLELVRDAATGRLQAYVLDGHMDNFVRLTNESFQLTAKLPGKSEPLVFRAVTTTTTGEKVGDTALFEAQAGWLKTTTNFDAVIESLVVRGARFENVSFNFPAGNEPKARH
jgi:hypothetical protein